MATYYNLSSSKLSNKITHCAFCKRNKEPEAIYKSHLLKDDAGLVTCPQLSKYRCELCGATGRFAHTRSYCPLANNFRRQCQQTEQEDISQNTDEPSTQDLIKVEPGMFRNMSKVTNSRYNSAGRLRSQYRDQHYQNQQPSVSNYNTHHHKVTINHATYWRPQLNQFQQRQQPQQQHGPQTNQLRGQRDDRNFAGNSI